MQKVYHVIEGFVRRYPYDPLSRSPLLSHVFARQCNTAGDGVNVFFFPIQNKQHHHCSFVSLFLLSFFLQ
jgi:hypothetical protein